MKTTADKATKRPWKVRYAKNLTAIVTPKGEMQLSLHGVYDGLKPLSVDLQEWEANAALIVAACNAYDGLREENARLIVEARNRASDCVEHIQDLTRAKLKANKMQEQLRLAIIDQAETEAENTCLYETLKAAHASLRTFRNVPQADQQWTSIDDDAMAAIEAAINGDSIEAQETPKRRLIP